MKVNVSRETAYGAPYKQGPMAQCINGRLDYTIIDRNGREFSRWWGGNSQTCIDDAIDRLNTECALFLMIEGTAAEHANT